MKYLSLLFFALLINCEFTFAQNSYRYISPLKIEDGLSVSSLSERRIDSTKFYRLFNKLNGEKHRLHSFILIKDDHLILEEYFNGYSIEKVHDLRSVSKSIRAL